MSYDLMPSDSYDPTCTCSVPALSEMNLYEINVYAFLMFLMLLMYVVPARDAVQSYVSICFAYFLYEDYVPDGSHHFLCAAHCSSKFFPRALCNAPPHETRPTRRAGAT